MKKQTLLLALIILISININAQINEKILSTSLNIAYFDSITVYENFIPIKRLNENVFMKKQNNTLQINEFTINIEKEEKLIYEDKNIYQIEYTCYDNQKNKYLLTVYYANYTSYFACLIARNTNIRYGFNHNN